MDLFEFANEREGVRLMRKIGVPEPWSEDRRLQLYHFTNIFREDDPTSQWIYDNLLYEVRYNPEHLFRNALVGRLFNNVVPLERIKHMMLCGWDEDEMFDVLRRRPGDLHPSWRFSGHYRARLKAGTTRLEQVALAVRHADSKQVWRVTHSSTKTAHWAICQLPLGGPLVANEIVADLQRFPSFFCGQPDCAVPERHIMRGLGIWAGKGRISHEKLFKAHQKLRGILEESRDRWDYPDRPWTLSTAARAALLYGRYTDDNYRTLRRGLRKERIAR